MVFCAQCGTPGEGRFCTECGARLADSGATMTTGTTRTESPPQYWDSIPGGYVPMPAATPAAHIGRAAFSGGMSAGTTSVGGTTSPGGTSAGGMTGVGPTPPTRSNVRGISGSPIVPATTAGGSSIAASATSAGFVNSPVASAPQQQESPTALFGSQGYRLDAFFHIAREIFVELDRSTQPVGTQMMEASKIRRSGSSTHVLPMYYQTIGAQCVGSNVLSWEGWNTFLAHKILSAPDEMFAQLGAVLRGLNLQLPWPLVRTDFPAYAYPDAAARELQFQQGIRNLAGAAIRGGGGHYGHGGGHARRSLISGLIGNSFLFN
ncbi:hypothetical protein C8F04DRAFT_1068082 [Mycena alexandri]|uniref:Zinc ribbon domain-containing protein n=1 Tax=Mycena alexandri TaxID=1745969 RepID=A0AAD6TJ60_9AGAR|nr:hypothetical protein C8F04DRAFT_1068082 [Mycena alexandri]